MIYNSHTHIFNGITDVPRGFLPLGLMGVLSSRVGYVVFSTILKNVNPFTDRDSLDKAVRFIQTGRLGSQEAIFNEMARFYPKETKFVVLTMDMAYMGAGDCKRKFKEQIEELGKLAKKDNRIIPFIHIDPRRSNAIELLKYAVEVWNYKGVKIYNSLGYFPYDVRLFPIYEYIQNKKLPIIAHCSPYNPVHYKGNYKDLYELLKYSKIPIDTKGKNKKELCSYFTNPKNWEFVLKLFPKINICVAHFGSNDMWEAYFKNPEDKENWFNIIKDMIVKYPNFYTDISYTLSNRDNFSLLKVLLTDEDIKPKVLSGSDFYMNKVKCDERRFSLDLRAYLGEELFKQIATINPENFLKI
jgi:predicted TIM-barrel fold metal-dependent hydrolase